MNFSHSSLGIHLYTPFIPSNRSAQPQKQQKDNNIASANVATSSLSISESVALPNTEEEGMRMLRLYTSEDMDLCPLDKWGILDPGEYRRDAVDQPDGLKREDGESSFYTSTLRSTDEAQPRNF